jgi:hypothetical protein
MSINVFCSCCFYYLIRMGNNPESKISKKNIAKKIIRGVLTLSFFPFAKNPLPSLLQETKRSPARYYFSQKRVRAPVHCETVGMRFLLARNSFSQNVQAARPRFHSVPVHEHVFEKNNYASTIPSWGSFRFL